MGTLFMGGCVGHTRNSRALIQSLFLHHIMVPGPYEFEICSGPAPTAKLLVIGRELPGSTSGQARPSKAKTQHERAQMQKAKH